MTDVKRLLDEATPLPWRVDPGPQDDPTDYVIYGDGPADEWVANMNADPPTHSQWSTNTAFVGMEPARLAELMKWENAELIVYAVNRLPDYEAAVDALESVLRFVRPEYLSDEGAIDTARAALARLRGKVAA